MHIFFPGFPMVILLVLVHGEMTFTGTLSIYTVLLAAGWQYQTAPLVIVFLSGLEVIRLETYITRRNWSWGYN